MPISRLGYVNNGTKKEFPVISALPREMTMTEFALLSDAEKMGDIIVTDYPVNEESDYVEVVADGVKTNSTLLDELFALVDRSRTNQGSVLIRNGIFHYCIQAESSVVVFTSGYVDTSASGSLMVTATLQASNSKLEVCKLNGTYTNNSSSVPTIGSALRIYYNDAHTFDFNTKAENCIFDPTGTSLSSTNAEDAIKEIANGQFDNTSVSGLAFAKSGNLVCITTLGSYMRYSALKVLVVPQAYMPKYNQNIPIMITDDWNNKYMGLVSIDKTSGAITSSKLTNYGSSFQATDDNDYIRFEAVYIAS